MHFTVNVPVDVFFNIRNLSYFEGLIRENEGAGVNLVVEKKNPCQLYEFP